MREELKRSKCFLETRHARADATDRARRVSVVSDIGTVAHSGAAFADRPMSIRRSRATLIKLTNDAPRYSIDIERVFKIARNSGGETFDRANLRIRRLRAAGNSAMRYRFHRADSIAASNATVARMSLIIYAIRRASKIERHRSDLTRARIFRSPRVRGASGKFRLSIDPARVTPAEKTGGSVVKRRGLCDRGYKRRAKPGRTTYRRRDAVSNLRGDSSPSSLFPPVITR